MVTDAEHNNFRDELRDLYRTDKTALALINWFYSRGKGSRETKARVAADRTGREYSEIVELFRKFDDLGLGRFVVGRRGAETRFEWNYDVKSIVRIATGEADEAEDVPQDAQEDDEGEDMLEHSFNLRPELTVTLRLPETFTAREAERLSGWIKSLPFDER